MGQLCFPPGSSNLRMHTTNENEQILAKRTNERTKEPNLPVFAHFLPIFRQKMGKNRQKRANKTEPWRNRAKPKVSQNFDSGSPLPVSHLVASRGIDGRHLFAFSILKLFVILIL